MPAPSNNADRHAQPFNMRDGSVVMIRPIRPDDEAMMVRFHQTLSPDTVYARYFNVLKLSQRIEHERLARICHTDDTREMVLVVERLDPESRQPQILAVGRLNQFDERPEGELAVLVSDRFQRQGLGTELMRRLIASGRERKLKRIWADILPDNVLMQRVCARVGMLVRHDDGGARAALDLDA